MIDRIVSIGLIVVLLLFLIYLASDNKKESLISPKNPDSSASWIRLYENFKFAGPGLSEEEAGAVAIETRSSFYVKRDLKINLKSYDINVPKGNVQIWAIYPDEQVASSSATGVSGYGDAYTDTLPWNGSGPAPVGQSSTTNALAANTKYRKVVEVKSGEHVTGMLDFPVKRILLYVSLDPL